MHVRVKSLMANGEERVAGVFNNVGEGELAEDTQSFLATAKEFLLRYGNVTVEVVEPTPRASTLVGE